MNLISRVLDFALYVGTIPFLCVGLFALADAHLVSRSGLVDNDLVEMVKDADNNKWLFDRLDEESRYIIAWLKIFGTNIDYPVVQGNDNSWFLNRNYKGDFATAGSIFLDYRNGSSFTDYFSIIYGHRMGNGEMFSDIYKFKDRAYFDEHRRGMLRMRDYDLQIVVVSYAEIDADDWTIYNVGRSRNDKNVIKYIMDRSEIVVNDVGAESHLLLSTCDGDKKNKRDVLLIGVLDAKTKR